MGCWPRRLAGALLALITFSAVGVARADDRLRVEAERRNRLASALYDKGQYDSALQMYQSAYDLHPAAKYLFNIGLAKEKIFDYEGCAIAFEQFLGMADQNAQGAATTTAEERRAQCQNRALIPVRVTSMPTNAAIFVREKGVRRPLGRTAQELKLAPGDYDMSVELAGYVSQSQIVSVKIGERPQPDFVLEKLSSLHIEVDPSGAEVKVDDLAWQVAPATLEIAAGVHRVEVRKAGYEDATRDLRVESGQEVSLVMPLRPKPTIRKLAIAANGADDEIAVDDGAIRPQPSMWSVSPGSHRVRVASKGFVPYAASITVPDDRDVRLEVQLEPQRRPRDRVIVWSLAGAAGLAGSVALVYGILTLADQREFDRNPTIALHDRGELHAARADEWLGVSAGLATTALISYLVTRPASSSAHLEALAP